MSRFYHPAGFADSRSGTPVSLVSLEADEAHHAARVLRLQVNASVELFDGKGRAMNGRIAHVDKKRVDVELLAPVDPLPSSGPMITIVAAMPKGDRLRWLVEKATELGVNQLIPLRSERSVVQGGTGKVEKMEQVVIAACKQCRRNDLMTVAPPVDWPALWPLLQSSVGSQSQQPAETVEKNSTMDRELPPRCYMAHPGGIPLGEWIRCRHEAPIPQQTVWLIGPEGGFSPAEVADAESRGTRLVSLGPQILRIETAVLMVAAVSAVAQ